MNRTETNKNRLFFIFKELGLFEIEIQLEDKESTTVRPLVKNENRQKGDKIQFKEKQDLEYYVDIYKEIFDEKDKSRNCTNYPTKLYKTYKECEKNSQRRFLMIMALRTSHRYGEQMKWMR